MTDNPLVEIEFDPTRLDTVRVDVSNRDQVCGALGSHYSKYLESPQAGGKNLSKIRGKFESSACAITE